MTGNGPGFLIGSRLGRGFGTAGSFAVGASWSKCDATAGRRRPDVGCRRGGSTPASGCRAAVAAELASGDSAVAVGRRSRRGRGGPAIVVAARSAAVSHRRRRLGPGRGRDPSRRRRRRRRGRRHRRRGRGRGRSRRCAGLAAAGAAGAGAGAAARGAGALERAGAEVFVPEDGPAAAGCGLVAADDVDRLADRLRPHLGRRGGGRRRGGGGDRPRRRGRQGDRGGGDAPQRREHGEGGDSGGAQAHAHTIGSAPPSDRQAQAKLWQRRSARERPYGVGCDSGHRGASRSAAAPRPNRHVPRAAAAPSIKASSSSWRRAATRRSAAVREPAPRATVPPAYTLLSYSRPCSATATPASTHRGRSARAGSGSARASGPPSRCARRSPRAARSARADQSSSSPPRPAAAPAARVPLAAVVAAGARAAAAGAAVVVPAGAAVVVDRRRRGGLGASRSAADPACGVRCAASGPRSDRPWRVGEGARPRPAVNGSDESPTLWLESELAAVVSPAASTRPATASTPIARVRRQPVMPYRRWTATLAAQLSPERRSGAFMPHLPSRVRWGWCRRPAAA